MNVTFGGAEADTEKISGYVTALYEFRSKQAFIYRTNRIKEIVGASYTITQAYDAFMSKLEAYNFTIKRNYTFADGAYHNIDSPLEIFADDKIDGEVIYIGGGNLCMLYRSKTIFIRANMIFSRMLLDDTCSLRVICAHCSYTGDFDYDRQILYKNKNHIKNTEPVTVPGAVLPFTEVDRKTSLPVAAKQFSERRSLSLESVKKLKMYEGVRDSVYRLSEENMDEMITEKGDESLLAVIYIDGNGLGERIKNLLNSETDYGRCAAVMRGFSNQIQQCFVSEPLEAIEQRPGNAGDAQGDKPGYRRIVGGGDEITIICNARIALELVMIYFDSLKMTSDNTACAGVAIFHSHTPFSEVYKIAEECCENGKKLNRKNGNNNCFVDFHFCRSGITNSLDEIRRVQEADYTNRPYCLLNNSGHQMNMLSEFERVANELVQIGRARVKSLSDALMRNDSDFIIELNRIKSMPGFGGLNLTEKDKKTIFDVSSVYDIWFSKDGEDRQDG